MQAILEKMGHSLAHTVPLETAKTKGSSNVRLLPLLMSAFLHWSVSLTLEAGLLSQELETWLPGAWVSPRGASPPERHQRLLFSCPNFRVPRKGL